MEPLWGTTAVVLLNPYSDTAQLLGALTQEMRVGPLPRWSVHVWLVSDWKRDPAADKSHLIVGFFVDDIFSDPIASIVQQATSQLRWEDFAEDFSL